MRKTIFFLSFSLLLCACEPLHFKIYLRNYTHGPLRLVLSNKSASLRVPPGLTVHYRQALLPIGKKTWQELTDSLPLQYSGDRDLELTVPAGATVYLSDLLPLVEHAGDNQLIINRPGSADTIGFNYPYKRIKGLRHKPDPGYRFFYRTICWFDIKDNEPH